MAAASRCRPIEAKNRGARKPGGKGAQACAQGLVNVVVDRRADEEQASEEGAEYEVDTHGLGKQGIGQRRHDQGAELKLIGLDAFDLPTEPRKQVVPDQAGQDEKGDGLAQQHGQLEDTGKTARLDHRREHRQQHQAEDVVKHCRGDDGLAHGRIEPAEIH